MRENNIPAIPKIAEEELALLDLLLNEDQTTSQNDNELVARTTDTEVPLSFAQESLLFLNHWHPDSAAYTIALCLRLKGALDTSCLKRAVAMIIEKHEILRTHFPLNAGRAVQAITPNLSLPFEVKHVNNADEAKQYAIKEASRPFDLSKGPLFRTYLIQQNETQYGLLLTFHHIIADAGSTQLLVEELARYYTAFRQGTSSDNPPLKIQYGDYALWQRRHLDLSRNETRLAFWRRYLQSASVTLLETDKRRRPQVRSRQGEEFCYLLPEQLVKTLRAFSRLKGITLYMVLLAGFALFLRRYSGNSDVLFGTVVTHRDRPELESLIGLFADILPLRLNLSGNPTVETLLQRVREQFLEVHEYALPFSTLVNALQTTRNVDPLSFAPIVFEYHNTSIDELKFPGLSVEPTFINTGTAKFDLHLSVEESEHGIHLACQYATDLYEADQVAQWLLHYQRLLEAMVAAPEQRIASLSLLSPDESQRLLKRWATSSCTDFTPSCCLHQAFQVQAAQHAEAEAVSCGEVRISYGELDRRSNQLAHYLRQHGVGTETIVGVLLERSIDLITALLAILKAGGAYLPLDPQAPFSSPVITPPTPG